MNVSCFSRRSPLLTASVLLGASALFASPAAHAQNTVTTLFNTGVNNSNALLAGGAADTHYTMIANNVGLTNGTNALVNSNQLVGTYAQNPNSLYISPDGVDGSSTNGGNYTLTYRTTFMLPTNVILSSVNITGGWSTDNFGTDILVNGNSTGFTSPSFGTFTSFVLPTTFFRTGANTLDFVWGNVGGPGGLNVAYTTKTFSTQAAGAPEPGSLALLGTGIVPLAGLVARRRRRAAKTAA